MDHPATVHDVNVLTVVASESYKNFVAALQEDISKSLSARPRVADEAYFSGKVLKTESGDVAITPQLAKQIYKYLLKHRHALVDLDKRGLAIKNFCTLGAAEGNVDKLVRQRMRGRGCCWSIAGATAMLAVLPHINALSEHVFEYHSTTKKEPCKNNIKETQGTGYRPVSGSLSFLKQRKNSEMWVELLKANLNSNLLLNEFF